MTAPNLSDIRSQARSVMVTRRPDLTMDDGDVSEMLQDQIAAIGDLAIGTGAQRVAATYLDGASGDELTELVSDHFGVDRQEATSSAGVLTFSRPSTGSGGTIAAGFRVATEVATDGSFIEYTTDIDLTFLAADLSLTVAATAVTPGPEGNAGPSAITRLLDTPFDTTIEVSNVDRFAGGNPEEDDDSLRARARRVERSRRRGTLFALETGAKEVDTVTVATAVESDNGIRENQSMEALAKLRPVFDRRHGTVTAGNSSQLTDGAAALVLASRARARELGLPVMGRVRSWGFAGCDPARMGLGPVLATPIALRRAGGLGMDRIELIELNEAFAAQVLACFRAFGSRRFCEDHLGSGPIGAPDPDHVNVNGGAIALGHPVGATGGRLVLTLLREMERREATLGLATLCVGGGQGAALVLERD